MTHILPDAPAIAGLTFGPLRGEEDAAALYAVHAGRASQDGIDPFCTFEDFPSYEDVRVSLAEATAAGQHDQWLVARVEDCVVGYSQIESWLEADGIWVYLTTG